MKVGKVGEFAPRLTNGLDFSCELVCSYCTTGFFVFLAYAIDVVEVNDGDCDWHFGGDY